MSYGRTLVGGPRNAETVMATRRNKGRLFGDKGDKGDGEQEELELDLRSESWGLKKRGTTLR